VFLITCCPIPQTPVFVLKDEGRGKLGELPVVLPVCLFIHREGEKSWFQTRVYEWDPCFQFPSRMVGTLLLAFICLYLVSSSRKIFSCFVNRAESNLGSLGQAVCA
jgi:hypothetical protein